MNKPWVTGPKELLEHGIEHLYKGTDFDLRMAIICIDNAVELSIKTFLGLSKSITKIEDLNRSKLDQLKENFPSLLHAIKKYAGERVIGIEIDDIEWFHKLRNQLYHAGNGITVEKQQVETYKEIAVILFKNLFNTEVTVDRKKNHNLIGKFISTWAELENSIHLELGYFKGEKTINYLLDELRRKKLITIDDFYSLEKLKRFRNDLVHGRIYQTDDDLIENTEELLKINRRIKKIS